MKKIAIIGHNGMVGKQLYKWFAVNRISPKYEVMGLSKDSQTHNWKKINQKADYIFIAVPTPFDWETNKYDLSILEEVVENIKGNEYASHPIVIIKSTVLPGTTEKLQEKRKDLKFIFNPEFLSAKTAYEDFTNPDRQLIGYTHESYSYAQEVLNLLPVSPYDVMMKATEAEICKYINNFHGALMVMFANFFYDVTSKFGRELDFEIIKKAAQASKWVGSPMGRMYWEVFHKGKRGYGGGCFPKDINSLIEWCKENKVDTEIIEATRKANRRILKKQGLTEKEVEKHNG